MASRMQPRRVLVVDDNRQNRELLQAYLEEVDCEVLLASRGAEALEIVDQLAPDVILLDVQMPGLDGLAVCRRIKTNPATRLLPVVMVTAWDASEDRVGALEAGADDLIAKPVDRLELVARVRSLLRLKASYDRLHDTERVVYALARAVEAKDAHTEAHTLRVASSARRLGSQLGVSGTPLDDLYFAAAVHDLGKIGVPDSILQKPGRLTAAELEIMRRHPIIGEQIAEPLSASASLLEVIRHHHERIDGEGYPDRLAGEEIPLFARIVAVCDAFDALTSDRPYRRRMTARQAVEVLWRGAGRQWDRQLVELLVSTRAHPAFSEADQPDDAAAVTGRDADPNPVSRREPR